MRWLLVMGLLAACASPPASAPASAPESVSAPQPPPPAPRPISKCEDRRFTLVVDFGDWRSTTTIACVRGVPTLDEDGPDWKETKSFERATWDAFWRDVARSGAVECGKSSNALRMTVSIDGALTTCDRSEVRGLAAAALERVRAAVRDAPRDQGICEIDPTACPKP